MLDFVTITFSDTCEINLLKIQAHSFKLVNKDIINNIYIVFNEPSKFFHLFNSIFNNIILQFYPHDIRHKINLFSLSDININDNDRSTWFSQQRVKIEISKFIKSRYYVVLDSKTHFIDKIDNDFFFNNDKPRLYFNRINSEMLTYYTNCFNYFEISCPNEIKQHEFKKIQTITPFLFIRNECLNLINYIEQKEKIPFGVFFINEQKYTEFFLYYAFLTFTKKRGLYSYIAHKHQPIIIIGRQNPSEHSYNSWEHKLSILHKFNISVFSLHRKSISILDEKYKQSLLHFYNYTYNDEGVSREIKQLLYPTVLTI
jgi:hypothetical protein